jgi:hypothetical protein
VSEARLPAGLEASAIRRSAEAIGGHAAVLHRGDPDRGAILLLLTERGEAKFLVERLPGADGAYRWLALVAKDASETIDKRRSFDPDLWVIEVDVADAERFIVDSLAAG